jgi:hypothetical protein
VGAVFVGALGNHVLLEFVVDGFFGGLGGVSLKYGKRKGEEGGGRLEKGGKGKKEEGGDKEEVTYLSVPSLAHIIPVSKVMAFTCGFDYYSTY